MQRHAERDRADEEGVLPDRQAEEGFILGQRVHRVEHLNRDENGQRHRRSPLRHLVREHLATDLWE